MMNRYHERSLTNDERDSWARRRSGQWNSSAQSHYSRLEREGLTDLSHIDSQTAKSMRYDNGRRDLEKRNERAAPRLGQNRQSFYLDSELRRSNERRREKTGEHWNILTAIHEAKEMNYGAIHTRRTHWIGVLKADTFHILALLQHQFRNQNDLSLVRDTGAMTIE